MTNTATFASRFAAAASALMISLVLITATVTTPPAVQAPRAYVGELA